MFGKRLTYFAIGIALVGLLAGCSMVRAGATGTASLSDVKTAVVQRGSLTASVGATGTVRSNQSAQVAWQTSGKVGDVSVRLGQQVLADQELAALDMETFSQSSLQAQNDLIGAQSALETLQQPQPLQIAQAEAALEQARTDLENLQNPSETAISQAELAVIDAQEAVDDAQYAVDALERGRGSAAQIESARASYLLAQDKVDHMQSLYNDTPGDPTEDPGKALALSNLETAKSQRDRALATLNWYLGVPSEAEIAEKNTQLALAQAQLADAQEKLETLQNPTETDIALAQAKLDDAQEKLDDLQRGASESDIEVAENRIALAQAALDKIQDNAHLTAPFAGTITAINVMKNDIVTNGRLAFQVDDLSRLFVDLDVSEIDIYRIAVGQPVSITFDAIPDRKYNGAIYEIGLVGGLDQGVVYFPVTVELTDVDESVKPGMTAVANVVVAQVEDVLQVPNRAVQTEDGKKVVYVLRGEELITVVVKVGLASDTVSEIITNEVQAGDQVLTSSPTAFRPGQVMGGGGGNVQP